MFPFARIPARTAIVAFCLGLLAYMLTASVPAGMANATAPDVPDAIVTQDLAHGLTPLDLANDLVGTGVSISNVTYTGTLQAAGRFTGGLPAIGIDHGIILGSGDIALVPGPNTLTDATAQNFMPGDAELSTLSGFPTFDADILEFDFVPLSDTVFFQYAFASEEYNEWVNTQFNDVFAFLINGQNCASVPGTGDPVSINTINNGRNPTFYRDNDFHPTSPYDTQLDGLTVPLLCQQTVIPGQTYHIKLAIADSGDDILDSDVFIQGGSFSSGPTPTPTSTFTPTSTPPTSTPTPLVSPTPTAICGPSPDYMISTGSDIIDPGTTLVSGSQCDDCSSAIVLPFTYSLYDSPFSTVYADSNGTLQFSTDHDISANVCLPYPLFSDVIAPFWDDLDTRSTIPSSLGELGIYTSLVGTTPDRIFNIEWRACLYNDGACGGEVNFEVKLYEGQPTFDIVYGVVAGGGAGATVGVQKDTGSQITEYECNTANSLWPGLLLNFLREPCPTATPTTPPTNTRIPTATPTSTFTGTPTATVSAILVGHVTWQGPPAQPNIRQQLPITLTLRLGPNPEVEYTGLTTDASGFFMVPVSTLPSGTYNWRVKGPQYLATCGTVALSGVPTTQQEMGLQSAGDCNNNNVVNITDFNILKNTFALSSGHSGFDARADFNGDGVVSVTDFSLLKNNFDQAGCSPILGPNRR